MDEILEKGAISGQVKISKMKFAAMCASHMAQGVSCDVIIFIFMNDNFIT